MCKGNSNPQTVVQTDIHKKKKKAHTGSKTERSPDRAGGHGRETVLTEEKKSFPRSFSLA